jgi:hypothetical protein
MNSEEMQSTWNSGRNDLPAGRHEALANEFALKFARRRRLNSIWLAHTFVWLTFITVVAVWNLGLGKVRPERDWALFPLLIIPWAFACHFLRKHLRADVILITGELPVAAALRAAQSANRAEQSRLKLVGILFAITTPILALSILQLTLAGKVSPRELPSMVAFFGTALLVGALLILTRYFGRVLPEARRLKALLGELAEEA